MKLTKKYTYELSEIERNEILSCLVYLGDPDLYPDGATQHDALPLIAKRLHGQMLDENFQ